MTRDHYAVLGVSPTSEDVVIRAAYRALMRRYHPDADPSGDAAQRAQAINAAYAVLGDPEKRARYDGSLAAQGLIKPETAPPRGWARRLVPGPAGMIGLAALAALASFILLSPPIGVLPRDALPLSAETARPAVNDHPDAGSPVDAAAALCDGAAVSGLIKSELLRRAASVPGVDRTRLERIGSYSVLRLTSPASRSSQAGDVAGCSAGAALDLPPGLVVEGGRTNLTAQLSYGVTGSSGGLRLAGLSGVGGLVRSLATVGPAPSEGFDVDLIPSHQAAARNAAPMPLPKEAKVEVPSTKSATVAKASSVTTEAATGSSTTDLTSKKCRLGDGWADRAICGSTNLTALDRQYGLLYAQSWARADDDKRTALLGSRDRFQQKRNACRSETCLTSAYLARLREVSDIMARRSQQ